MQYAKWAIALSKLALRGENFRRRLNRAGRCGRTLIRISRNNDTNKNYKKLAFFARKKANAKVKELGFSADFHFITNYKVSIKILNERINPVVLGKGKFENR